MTNGLVVTDLDPLGERPKAQVRGWTGKGVAGVDSLVGDAMVGTLLDGQVWVKDPATGNLVPGYAEDLGTAETDPSLVLAPDGAGGVEFRAETGGANAELNIEGGQDVIKAHGSMGSTETFDPTDGNVHTGTLDANCTITLAAPAGSGACTLELWLTEDGTGGHTVTWPGTVTEQGTHDTTAGTTQRVIVESIDGGANWIATWVGSGGSSLTIKDEGTPLATAATSLDFVGAGVTASGTGAGKTVTIPGGASALSGLSDVTLTGPAAGQFLRYSGSAWLNALLIVADYPFHAEPLCDSSGPILTALGDVIMVIGVPN